MQGLGEINSDLTQATGFDQVPAGRLGEFDSAAEAKSRQHPGFPAGHPCKY